MQELLIGFYLLAAVLLCLTVYFWRGRDEARTAAKEDRDRLSNELAELRGTRTKDLQIIKQLESDRDGKDLKAFRAEQENKNLQRQSQIFQEKAETIQRQQCERMSRLEQQLADKTDELRTAIATNDDMQVVIDELRKQPIKTTRARKKKTS